MARRAVAVRVGRSTIRGSVPYGATAAQLRAGLDASLADVVGNLRAFVEGIDAATPEILLETLEPTFVKSQIRCPFRTGDLRASGYLETRKGTRTAEVEIGYGRGGHPDYAIHVHEVPAYHQPPTQDKFLQSAIEEDAPDYPAIIAAKIQEVAGT
jgi:hypothetical protein